ncbi:leukocyte immunoglobulin-like receptor subfamily A member 1 isoform X7 [Ovis canadensis]|uniref:leukocyte immunoglobulin-like receptor subfamily A member 1 isoform X7 n=1 Tax=Ovis canadensis TaxID=37174 RepID=UPI0037516699
MRGSATTLTFTALLCLGLCWGQRDQGQPEVLPKPSIRADPGTTVAQGSPVTIWCQGSLLADVYRLYKERSSVHWEAKTPQGSRNRARFHFASLSSSAAGQYQCAYQSRNSWSALSDPLPLVVTGLSRAPSLSAQPGSLVLPGDNLTLQCRSEAGSGSFALTKDEGLSPPLRLEGQQSPDFPLGRVSRAHGGRYRCYSGHNLSYAWSAPSAPLDILIAGMHRKPSLSARPGASVPQGENMTLQCRSEVQADTFHLSKEGSLAAPQHLRLQDLAPPVQANFTLRAVTSAHSGTYRCYSSHSTAPHLLSLPSDPLELLVSGAADSISPPQNKSDSKSGRTSRLPALLTRGPRRISHGRGRSSCFTPAGSVQSHEGREPHCSCLPSLVCAMTSIPSQKQNVV